MNLSFKESETLMHTLQEEFKAIGIREAMFLDHHDLADLTPDYSAEDWKVFLKHPLVADYLLEELTMFRDKQIKTILRNADSNERSVGVSQMINSLSKLDLTQTGSNNKIFVYTYIPLDEEEAQAENVQVAPSDIFKL